jgi:hypothetical protein
MDDIKQVRKELQYTAELDNFACYVLVDGIK